MTNPIEKYRTDNGMTFQSLGDRVGIPRHLVWKHCKAETIPGESALRYHHALGIPLEELRPDIYASGDDEPGAAA